MDAVVAFGPSADRSGVAYGASSGKPARMPLRQFSSGIRLGRAVYTESIAWRPIHGPLEEWSLTTSAQTPGLAGSSDDTIWPSSPSQTHRMPMRRSVVNLGIGASGLHSDLVLGLLIDLGRHNVTRHREVIIH